MVLTIVVTILVLAVLIIVHELGHFVAARAFDIRVPRFSIGFGPKLLSVHVGETEYRIGLLPLGGYVKLAGMEEVSLLEGGTDGDDEAHGERTFGAKTPAARAIVLGAGVFMNGVLAVVLFAVVALVWGAPVPGSAAVGDVVEERLPEGAAALADIEPGSRVTRVGGRSVTTIDDVSRALMSAPAGEISLEFASRAPITIQIPAAPDRRRLLPVALAPVRHSEPVIGEVIEGGAAERAGLQAGDTVTAVDGQPVESWQEMARAIEASPGRPVEVAVRRAGRSLSVTVTPAPVATAAGTVGRLQAALDRRTAAFVPRERLGPAGALAWGLRQSGDVVLLVGDFVSGLVQRRYSLRDLGGPIMIGEVSGAAARAGAPVLLFLTALLSVNLAVINLLPIPALDGGHLVLLAVETVRGRPTSERTRRIIGRIGVTLVVVIMLWAITADVLRLLAG